jgi:hypothetical protein
MRARQDRRQARSGGLHDLIRCTRRIPRAGGIFPSAETGAETADRKIEPVQIGEPRRHRLAGLFGDPVKLFGTQRRIFRQHVGISSAGTVDRTRTEMQHAPDAASRRRLDRSGRTTDVDANDPDGITDLAAGPGGDRGKMEDASGLALTQRGFEAFRIGDVPDHQFVPAGKASEPSRRMVRKRTKIEAGDAFSAHQQGFRHRQSDKARRPRDKRSHRIRPPCETACPNR